LLALRNPLQSRVMITQRQFDLGPLTPGDKTTGPWSAALDLAQGNCAVILDAAADPQVPELLARTDGAGCLWDGAAGAQWARYAPWLAPVGNNDALLINLMTEGKAGWHWWNRWPGIIVRHRRGLRHLRTHLKRLSRVSDATGQNYFLRFWEPAMADAFWASHADDTAHLAWRYGEDVAEVILCSAGHVHGIALADPLPRQPAPTHAIDSYRPLFRAARWQRFCARVHDALHTDTVTNGTHNPEDVAKLCIAARDAGYHSEAAIWDVVRAMILFSEAGVASTAQTPAAWRDAKPPDDRSAARQLLDHARRVAQD